MKYCFYLMLVVRFANVVALYKDGKYLALDYWHDDFEECDHLTHWMPLPKPPME